MFVNIANNAFGLDVDGADKPDVNPTQFDIEHGPISVLINIAAIFLGILGF